MVFYNYEGEMNKLMIKLSILGGLCSGVACFVLFVVLLALNAQPLGAQQFVYFPIYALGMIVIMKYFRDYRNAGVLHAWQGIAIGLIYNLVASILYALLVYGWLTYFSPKDFNTFKQEVVQKNNQDFHKLYKELAKLDTAKEAEREIYTTQKEQIDDYVKTQEGIQNLASDDLGKSVWMKTFGIGILMSMVIGLLFKKLPKTTPLPKN